jgi:hypothetical protein
MASPKKPEEQDASELWLALTALPRPHRVVPFPRNLPGTDIPVGEVAIWPLTQEEHHLANAAADDHVKKLLKDPQKKDEANVGYDNLFANELAVQQLQRACRDPKNLERAAFPSPKDLRMRLTTDEVGVLYNHYLTTQCEVGPIVAYMSEEEFEAWVRRLAEGGSSFFYSTLSWDLRNQLLHTMASRLAKYMTGTGSPGTPQDDDSLTDSEAS